MKVVRIIFFILFATLIYSTPLQAQINLFSSKDLSQVNIDDYTDAQIASMLKRATESGMTVPQLIKLVSDKGLPETEIEKLRNRIEVINKSALQPEQVQPEITEQEKRPPHEYDTTESNVPVQKVNIDQSIFGSELFTTNSLVFEPNLRIPAPAGYILGPDDEIVVSVYGYSEKTYNLRVDEKGEVYIPNVGPILVSGLSIEQAGEKIRARLAATIYRAINSGRTKVQVSLGKIKSIRVTVIGQANKPGTFTVSSLTTLYNVLYLCGGPTALGSYRQIEIIRGNQEKRTADLYDFLVNGSQKDNILLQEGDVIRIPYYKNRVTLSGNVKREGKYEMLDSETFSDLLKFSGGFTDNAYRGAVTVIRITDTEKKVVDVATSEYDTFKLMGSDQVQVRKLQDQFGNRIIITGSVLRPGIYEFTPNITVKNLVEKAGGITPDAYTARASIFRYFNNKMPTIVSVNLDSVLNYNQQVLLKKDDSLNVHSIFEFNDTSYVSVEGNVRKPGVVEWRENITLHDVLLSVGGLSEFGDSTNIEISRRIRNVNVGTSDHNESQVFNINLASSPGNSAGNMRLQPYDMVMVKARSGYVTQRSILILGEVKSQGRYGLKTSGEQISDVIKRTGGFKASADSTSITIRRSIKSNETIPEREKLFQRILNINPDSLSENQRLRDELYKTYDLISVNLKYALAHPESSENLALEEGDILTVNRSTNLVKVSGEVYYPTIVPYKKNKTLKYYVQQAGNFTNFARKSGALVINPDGKAQSVKHFLFFRSYPDVNPRSEIFVPQKNKSNRQRLGTGELALIVSALGILANVIINIK
jgi:protein involved in polysaccharide export with SLBB domain